MSKKFSPSLIGGFVLGGLALFIGALFLFGSGDMFKEKRQWVTFFDGSVGGLNVGAPVNFRGVRVGTVTDVQLMLDSKNLTARIPVYFQIDPDAITWSEGKEPQSQERAAEAGLRAKLAMQSLVTGQMLIELDLLPDTPAKLVGADRNTLEIASIPSDFDLLKREFADLPLAELVASVQRAVDGINVMISAPETQASLKALAGTLDETQKLMAQVNQEAGPLMREMTATMQSARNTSDQAGASLKAIDGEAQAAFRELRQLSGDTRADVRTALKSLDTALKQAHDTLGSINGIVAEDAQTRRDMDRTLHNIAQASASLRSFADTVDRNPNALVVGE